MNQEHYAAARTAILKLIKYGVPAPESSLEETAQMWVGLMGRQIPGPRWYGILAASYISDPEAAHPRWGYRWPMPGILLRYLPASAPRLDLAEEFQFLHGVALIRPFERYDPKLDKMVTVTREEQQLPRMLKRYGDHIPAEVSAGLREMGGLQGLRLRVKTQKDLPYEQRKFMAAGAEVAQLPQLPGVEAALQLTVEVVHPQGANVVPFRRAGEG